MFSFIFIPVYCEIFLLTLGELSVAVLRSPGKTPGTFNFALDGSVNLDTAWINPDDAKDEGSVGSDTDSDDTKMGTPGGGKPKDDKSEDFTVHLYKQTMKVFDTIKKSIAPKYIKDMIDNLSTTYKEKFAEFVKESQHSDVRTGQGDHKAVLHAVDMSSLILQRLVNTIKAKFEKYGMKNIDGNSLQKIVDAERDLEYEHVCSKYGYCRSSNGFNAMIKDVIRLLLTAPDDKMQQAIDTFTEVAKNADYSRLIDSKTEEKLKRKIERLETTEPKVLKDGLRVLLGVVSQPNSPMVVQDGNTAVVEKTIAFRSILSVVENLFPANSKKRDWEAMVESIKEWMTCKNLTDSMNITDSIENITQTINDGVDKMNGTTIKRMRLQIKLFDEIDVQ